MNAEQLQSNSICRDALEAHLKILPWEGHTAWTNKKLNSKSGKPEAGVPYREVQMKLAEPYNGERTNGFTEQGIFYVRLFYPAGKGTAEVDAYAYLIRDHFPRMLSLPLGGLTVQVLTTPAIDEGQPDGDRYPVVVKIRFQAEVPNTNY